MTGLLASVTNPTEALLALGAGADIIDCKDPTSGALGALAEPIIRAIVHSVGGRRPVSATIGDLPTQSDALIPAVRRVGATGVEYVKLGLLDSARIPRVIDDLAGLTSEHRLIAVLFADRPPLLESIPLFAAAGFAGVMLDTADKRGGTLLDRMPADALGRFVHQARRYRLLCGLAGSLRLEQLDLLLPLCPDYLGFRGALCEQGRTSGLSPTACTRVRAAIPTDQACRSHPEAA